MDGGRIRVRTLGFWESSHHASIPFFCLLGMTPRSVGNGSNVKKRADRFFALYIATYVWPLVKFHESGPKGR